MIHGQSTQQNCSITRFLSCKTSPQNRGAPSASYDYLRVPPPTVVLKARGCEKHRIRIGIRPVSVNRTASIERELTEVEMLPTLNSSRRAPCRAEDSPSGQRSDSNSVLLGEDCVAGVLGFGGFNLVVSRELEDISTGVEVNRATSDFTICWRKQRRMR
jgi:hypothetical protein